MAFFIVSTMRGQEMTVADDVSNSHSQITTVNSGSETVEIELHDSPIPIPIFLRGENPALQGGSESDNSCTDHHRLQTGYSMPIPTIAQYNRPLTDPDSVQLIKVSNSS